VKLKRCNYNMLCWRYFNTVKQGRALAPFWPGPVGPAGGACSNAKRAKPFSSLAASSVSVRSLYIQSHRQRAIPWIMTITPTATFAASSTP
jgi:hypothetical protein